MRGYGKYAKPYLSAFIIGPCLMITEVLGEVMLPKMMSLIINNGVASHDQGYILRMGLWMVCVAFAMAASGIGGALFYQRLAQRFVCPGAAVFLSKY